MPRVIDPGAVTLKITSSTKRVFIGTGLAILLAVLGYGGYVWCLNSLIKPSALQAVFLTDGQIYFGKVANPWSKYVRLTDVYYFQAKDGLSPDISMLGSGDVTLIKLGKEAHGPEDKLEINRDQVMFIQDLKDDSKVVKAIKDFKGK